MDAFGIGAGIRGSAETYLRSARRTGRTTAMLQALRNGDRVLCGETREADRLRRLLKERGLDVQVLTVPPRDPCVAFRQSTSPGRTIFDHSWLEQFYVNAIEDARKDIDKLQTQLSGYGEEHIQTRLKAKEVGKWDWQP